MAVDPVAAVGAHHHRRALGLGGGVLLTQLHHSLERDLDNFQEEQGVS